ncbi:MULTISPECIES: YoaK family small membrane protein [Serratia]|uniref:YoaK family small membrane protein n=1 Tax=Serratia marcescens TaxID=615 RepID=A0ABD5BE77_SERMA|nr:YoaK family small membrane protein [Serratia marcescens]ELH4238914.1 YoaK family small membrane protein [Serratia marcescens]ELM0003395.1 YoaK family small membrane protein [Serratia marcescens]MBH3240635.1 YoaK family small membrane protein [Serratia marcescens]MBN5410147.1 YoaK family small membrane protein [Serratia marcescens]MDP8025471.1 YoaK family small membrane protein [Serratia marcescens]
MKIGYLFPVAVIVGAVVLMAWFIIGGYAMPA